jgi:hypothetical protein
MADENAGCGNDQNQRAGNPIGNERGTLQSSTAGIFKTTKGMMG